MKRLLLKAILVTIPQIIKSAARKHPEFRQKLRQHNCVIQLRLRDSSIARRGRPDAGKGVRAYPQFLSHIT